MAGSPKSWTHRDTVGFETPRAVASPATGMNSFRAFGRSSFVKLKLILLVAVV